MKKDSAGSIESFLARITFVLDTGCWRWNGAHLPNGYGIYRHDGQDYAHRWAYQYFVGHIPIGAQLDHVWNWGCRYRDCANPAHLEPVTPAQNSARSVRARQTHCLHGHVFDVKNTRIRSNGTRQCKQCARQRARRVNLDS